MRSTAGKGALKMEPLRLARGLISSLGGCGLEAACFKRLYLKKCVGWHG